jgi:hypothetical protein
VLEFQLIESTSQFNYKCKIRNKVHLKGTHIYKTSLFQRGVPVGGKISSSLHNEPCPQ